MVYKKIRNKIPSLSCLLLAGVLLGSSCPSKKDNDGAAAGQAGNHEGGEGKDHVGNARMQVLDPDLAEADEKIRKVLMQALGLDYLGKKDPYVLDEQDFNAKGIRRLGKELAESFTHKYAGAYPVELVNGCFVDLAKIKEADIKQPRAFARALNLPAAFCQDLHNLVKEMWESLSKGGGSDALKELKTKSLDALSSKLEIGTTRFMSSYKFSDVAEPKLLDGPQLARFLTDLDKKGSPKGNSNSNGTKYDAPTILNQCLQLVWIKNKASSDGCKENKEGDINYLSQRGSGLGEQSQGTDKLLKVKGGEGFIPYIPKLDNGTLTKKFDTTKLLDYCDEEKNINLNNLMIDSAQSTSIVLGTNAASESKDVQFGTLLFTLFRGTTEFDFLNLVKDGEAVVLKGNNANFQKWIGKDHKEFANQLYQRIQNDAYLKDLFPIPNLNSFFEVVLPSTQLDVIDKGEPAKNSALEIICVGILNKLNLSVADQSKAFDCVKRIANLKASLGNSDVTLDQALCIKLAAAINGKDKETGIQGDAASGKLPMTKAELVNLVVRTVTAESNKAIVKIGASGGCEPTAVSNFIKNALDSLSEKLKAKHANAGLTYQDITSLAKGFNIEKVREVYQGECNKLQGVLLTDITPVLIKQGDITEADFNQIEGLRKADIGAINKIKEAYQSKRAKKLNATSVK